MHSRGTRPNILLITCHDLGRFLGCYGVATVRTPNLDVLAADGVRFTRAFCAAPQCSPARSALFTGRFPHSNGVMGQTNEPFDWDLKPDEQHLGQALHAAGYATALVGVYHEGGGDTVADIAGRTGMEQVVRVPRLRHVEKHDERAFRGDAISDVALSVLASLSAQGRPFYLQVGYLEPHRLLAQERGEPDYLGFIGDYIAPDATLGVTVPPYLGDTAQAREELAELQGAVHYVDACIGRVLAGLRDLRLEDNTLVLFTTDHGIGLPRAKCTLYDPGIETALIMRLPSQGWTGGRTQTELVSGVDIFPTLLDLAGISVPARVQGCSLLPLLDGQSYTPRDAVFAEMTFHLYYNPMRCVRTQTHKLIVNFCAAPFLMDASQSWRPRTEPLVPAKPPIVYHPLVELYDLVNDPWEQRNVADAPGMQDVQRSLLALLSDWMVTTEDPLLHGPVTEPTHGRALAVLRAASRAT